MFTNGCFDLLHPGHVYYLKEAKALGDKLIVGLNSDASINILKGANRPINDEVFRREMLLGLSVDLVILFSEETPIELIKRIQPDVLVKGGDYDMSTIVGAEFVQSNGGEVKVLSFLEGYSSSSIIKKILSSEHDNNS